MEGSSADKVKRPGWCKEKVEADGETTSRREGAVVLKQTLLGVQVTCTVTVTVTTEKVPWVVLARSQRYLQATASGSRIAGNPANETQES